MVRLPSADTLMKALVVWGKNLSREAGQSSAERCRVHAVLVASTVDQPRAAESGNQKPVAM